MIPFYYLLTALQDLHPNPDPTPTPKQDLRLFNCDRHEGNVLVCSPKPEDASSSKDASSSTLEGAKLELVPIDHAFIQP